MARYSCLYAADGRLLEIAQHRLDKDGKAIPREWFRSTDPKEAAKFIIKDNVEISDDTATIMKALSEGGGGNGLDKTSAQLAEPKAISAAASAKLAVDAAIAEVLAIKPAANLAVK